MEMSRDRKHVLPDWGPAFGWSFLEGMLAGHLLLRLLPAENRIGARRHAGVATRALPGAAKA